MKLAKISILAIAAACAFSATAQEAPRAAYFLDGYTLRHQLNPAFGNERGYVQVPVLFNYNIGLFSNVGLSTFLYPMDGSNKLTTFMSPTVPADKFLGKLNESNHINLGLGIDIFSFGFKALGGFNTVEMGLKVDGGIDLPKDLFKFMKVGQDSYDTQYSFGDIGAYVNARTEIALGHSRQITDALRVGAKVKVLLGLASVDARVKRLDVRMTDKYWDVSGEGRLEAAVLGKALYVPTLEEVNDVKDDKDPDLIAYDKIDFSASNISLPGFGLGFDLGATYQLLPDLELSASIQDLGFMNWSNAVIAETGTGSWHFDGFHDIAIRDDQEGYDDNNLGEQLKDQFGQLEDMVGFHRTSTDGSYTKALHATLHIGAEYKMPFYKNLTAGALFTSYFAGISSWQEGRIYATVKPTKWFDCTINYGLGTYGDAFGWMINFHPKGVNLFIGSDHTFFKVNPQFIPVGNINASINMGLNFTFGS